MKPVSLLFLLSFLLLNACSNHNQPTKQNTLIARPPVLTQNQLPQPNTTCREVVYQILTTSPRFKALTKGLYDAVVKNGGASYGIDLEGSPNPTQDSAMDYSKTYDFALHETYPDRDVVTARFTFNLSSRQLYEYNVAEDSLTAIDFDKKLLLKSDFTCK